MTGIPDAESVTPHICNAAHPDDCTKPDHPMSAGDRDTLTDEEREQINAAIRGGRGYYESTTRTHKVVESIVAARVRAAQAQAWDEGYEQAECDVTQSGLLEKHNLPNPYRRSDD